jgi:hypothetical protein
MNDQLRFEGRSTVYRAIVRAAAALAGSAR